MSERSRRNLRRHRPARMDGDIASRLPSVDQPASRVSQAPAPSSELPAAFCAQAARRLDETPVDPRVLRAERPV